ncbi:antibiotic biosynthesis monooxygenase family protein [Neokomagataea anthophila]|uniref:Antibiotic biosynthesis monooxygenase n=1 Tax=Neokomagataea anthophila TaxID=2826925 RepID=A0ABS5E960_9PROT|nr:antibiotic biosynthesis monooxygenase [Neokomagataea anthophila]MBR0560444.1 antibiotic biosynthesis monooxygenase [Neokomagataea anthophila]
MYIAMNRFKVSLDCEEAFESRWLNREVLLKKVPGFVSFQFLKGPRTENYTLYVSHTVWESHDAFMLWTRSDHFRQAHAAAGEGKKLTISAPVFEGFSVLQNIDV